MAKKSLSFKQSPGFKEMRFLSAFLDFVAEMPWSNPLLLWLTFLSIPLWFGLLVLLLIVLFILDNVLNIFRAGPS
ncbi:MAG: hypothetical protein CRU72_16610 [Candidatus Accumulibacter phosphatis]|jgi:hypothetical protein|nr:hypothetical protein [Candidatus Accumulibacter phosphatis]